MLQTPDDETEILLGNKQLLGIFFVVAILLGVAFTGGYMVGKGSPAKKIVANAATPSEAASQTSPTPAVGETHSVPAETPTDTASAPAPRATDEPPLGSPRRKTFEETRPKEPLRPSNQVAPTPAPSSADASTPESGETFLQVAAVTRDEAVAVADVLHKKGFRARAVPVPGNAKMYRVLIGPVADAADLSLTRDSLRKTGFREVIVRKY